MAEELSIEERATNAETMKHIHNVTVYLHVFIRELLERATAHDASKLEHPEVEAFTRMTPMLHSLAYGSPEYQEALKALGPALAHHYAKNPHHPEHYKHGIADMTLVDFVEMVCDWKAATKRHDTGNLLKSIETNGDRFGMPPMLVRILENTAALFEGI